MNCCVWGKSVARIRILLAITVLVAGAVALSLVSPRSSAGNFPQAAPSMVPFAPHSPQQLHVGYGQLPLAFEPNLGQTDAQVKFMARGSKFGLFLTSQEAVLKLAQSSSLLQMSLAGSNPEATVAGTDALPGRSNYLVGNDPSRWHRDIPQFARVRYSQVYPGIDLVYYGKQGKLEYDFEVLPGANPSQVALQFQGADRLILDRNGDLVLGMKGGEMRLEAPRVFQTVNGEQKAVEGKFVLQANQQVGFEVGSYDRRRTLVIDPVLTYSTYLGGGGAESFPAIAVDAASNAYIAGTTTSADFPIVAASAPTPVGSFQICLNDPTQPQPADVSGCASPGTNSDIFVAKFDPSGTVLLFSTYLGGGGNDIAGGVAVDAGFNVIVAGTTNSSDFPVMNAYQPSQGTSAANHVFVSKVDAAGQHLLYSTYLRGTATETASGVAVDNKNKIYLTGTTDSTDFPVTADAFQDTSRATHQFFISKIDPAMMGTPSLVYSTYFGGGTPANGGAVGGGIAVDTSNAVYITGTTNFQHTGGNPSTDFPILNAFQSCLDDPTNPAPCPTAVTNTDAFVAKLNPAAPIGSHLVYSTYFGGSGNDAGTGISVNSGFAYITGTTNSGDIPIPTGAVAFQQCLGAGTTANPVSPATCPTVSNNDAFLAKLSSFTSGTATNPNVTVLYFSYLGGSGDDHGLAIAADGAQGAHITGSTSGGFDILPVPNPVQGSFGGGATDAFVTTIDTTATSQTATGHSSTYLGGSGPERGTGIALDAAGATYVAGDTSSGNFPTASAFQNALDGSSDAFLSKLGPKVSLAMTATASPQTVGIGSPVTFTFTITNNGDTVPSITYVNNLPPTGSLGSTPPGNCGPQTGTPPTVTCNLGLLKSGGTTTIAFSLTPGSTQPAGPSPFSDTANLIAPGLASAGASVTVNDYSLSLAPNSATVVAGSAATYNATVTPTGAFPGSVSLSCTGLPTGTSCSVANGAITNLTNGSPQSRSLVVNTTARTTTTVQLRQHGPVFAVWLPVSGLAFLGLGIGGTMSRKRRVILGLLIGSFFVLVFLQAGCGSKSSGTTVTTGTPAGTYTFTVTATSGSASRNQIAQLVVQ